jgi:hypothetical protein
MLNYGAPEKHAISVCDISILNALQRGREYNVLDNLDLRSAFDYLILVRS